MDHVLAHLDLYLVMRPWDLAGWLASGLVLAAFCMTSMVPLRAVALSSNVAFIAYGAALDLKPVWLLHAVLLPVNLWRLHGALRGSAPHLPGRKPGGGAGARA